MDNIIGIFRLQAGLLLGKLVFRWGLTSPISVDTRPFPLRFCVVV